MNLFIAVLKLKSTFFFNTRSITTVWKCTEDWDALYAKWASVEFSQLDVDDCEEGTAMIELELEEAKEIIGSSPMSHDLMAKVQATTQKLPVLKVTFCQKIVLPFKDQTL